MTYHFLRRSRFVVSSPRLTLAALLVGVLAPKAALATQGAELYRTSSHFYGRFEARVRYAPGEGVVSSFFLWKEGSSSTTTWNELDYEKINGDCRLTTNIWTGQGTQSSQTHTLTFDVCADYHTYVMEWTPDYIAWFIDGTQIRRVMGASVTEYTRNAAQGMAIHFNLWAGNSSFGGNLNPSTLPVRQYINWVAYSSYANGAFQAQWREDFNGSTTPSGWALGNWDSPFNLSKHNPANVSFVNGIAVLSLTADNATGFTGTPPADTSGGSGGTSGSGGAGGRGGSGGSAGSGGRGGAGGSGGTAAGGGRGGTSGGASGGSGGTSPTGSGGTAGAGVAGNGAGGTSPGTAGSGAGGMATGAAGNGAGGTATGAAGNGTGAGGTSATGSGGATATGGSSATGSGGATATGGSSGGAGSPSGAAGSPPESDPGCDCSAAGGGLGGGSGLIAVLLIAAGALRRRAPTARRHPRT